MGKGFVSSMEGVPQSQEPLASVPPLEPSVQRQEQEFTPEYFQALKARAREDAIRQVMEQRAQQAQRPQQQIIPAQPQVVYVRRNLTVAEVILVFALSCGMVVGLQAGWSFASNLLPKIEIRVK
jgi:hypothetical protein